MDNIFKFRRQYLVCSEKTENSLLQSWKADSIGSYHIYYHPDEHFTKVETTGISAVMFGFMVCPYNKLKNNNDILSEIIGEGDSLDNMLNRSKKYCGRFAVIIKLKEDYFIFNDVTAQKQIYYSSVAGKLTISSSDHLIATVNGYKQSEKIAERFLKLYSDQLSLWFPGDSTLFDEIKFLIPNHYFSFATNQIKRFWPNQKADQKNWKKNLEPIHNLLGNYIDNFIERYPAAVALTAGLDSRILLAYFKKHLDKIFTYTIKNNQPERILDFTIPKMICDKLGINYILYDCNEEPPREFVDDYKLSASFEREQFRSMAYYLVKGGYPQERISVQGGVNEIARTRYGYRPYVLRIKELVNMTAMGDNEFCREKFSEWLVEGTEVNKKYNVSVEDIFFLEQRLGRWHSNNRVEWDIAQDVFEPFNSRLLLEHIFNIHKSYKVRYPNKLYEYLFSKTWPELYQFEGALIGRDFNLKKTVKDYIKAVLYRIS